MASLIVEPKELEPAETAHPHWIHVDPLSHTRRPDSCDSYHTALVHLTDYDPLSLGNTYPLVDAIDREVTLREKGFDASPSRERAVRMKQLGQDLGCN